MNTSSWLSNTEVLRGYSSSSVLRTCDFFVMQNVSEWNRHLHVYIFLFAVEDREEEVCAVFEMAHVIVAPIETADVHSHPSQAQCTNLTFSNWFMQLILCIDMSCET